MRLKALRKFRHYVVGEIFTEDDPKVAKWWVDNGFAEKFKEAPKRKVIEGPEVKK